MVTWWLKHVGVNNFNFNWGYVFLRYSMWSILKKDIIKVQVVGSLYKYTVLEFITQYISQFLVYENRVWSSNQAHMWELLDCKAGKQRYETQHNQKQQLHTARTQQQQQQQHILPAPTRIPQCRPRALPLGNRRHVNLRMSRAQMNVTAFRKPYTMPSRSNVNWHSWTELTGYILYPHDRATGPTNSMSTYLNSAHRYSRAHEGLRSDPRTDEQWWLLAAYGTKHKGGTGKTVC